MIELLIINSLIIWGVYASIQEGFIFERIGLFIRGRHWIKKGDIDSHYDDDQKDNLPSWIKKPLGTCPVCMASVYGTPVFWFAYLIGHLQNDYIIIIYICYIFALAGVNYLILAFMPENKEDVITREDVDQVKYHLEQINTETKKRNVKQGIK